MACFSDFVWLFSQKWKWHSQICERHVHLIPDRSHKHQTSAKPQQNTMYHVLLHFWTELMPPYCCGTPLALWMAGTRGVNLRVRGSKNRKFFVPNDLEMTPNGWKTLPITIFSCFWLHFARFAQRASSGPQWRAPFAPWAGHGKAWTILPSNYSLYPQTRLILMKCMKNVENMVIEEVWVPF